LPASVSREALGLFCGASAASRSGRRSLRQKCRVDGKGQRRAIPPM